MKNIDKAIIETLKKIGEDIETLNLSDYDAWNGIYTEFEGAIRGIQEELPELFKLISLCLEGLRAISEGTVANLLTVTESLNSSLSALEQYMLNSPNSEDLVKEAVQTLENALAKDFFEKALPTESETAVRNDDGSGEVIIHTIDDAASLLIQIEPDDTDGLTRLLEALDRIVSDEAYPAVSRENIIKAALIIDGIIAGSVADPVSAFKEIGKYLEEAAYSKDDEERKSLEPTGVSASDSVKIETEKKKGVAEAKEIITPEKKAEPLEEAEVIIESTGALSSEIEVESQGDELKVDYMPEDADPDLLAEFISEGRDLIANAEEALLTLENDPDDMEAVGTVFRAFHTIKGTSAFLNITLASEMGHHAESLLSRVRDREIRYSGGYADLTLRALDMIKELVQSIENALAGNAFPKPSGYDDLMGILANPEQAGISDEYVDPSDTDLRVGEILVGKGKTVKERVEETLAKHSGRPIGLELVKSDAVSVNDVVKALRTQKQIKTGKQVVESSVRVGTERLDRLIDMVGELVVAHSMLAQDDIVVTGNHHELIKKVAHTTKIIRQMQDLGMSMRMIPLKSTFQKMARLVRDLARKAGKNISFITEGEDTEIDRNMVDVINDPLVHMVRNAVDHGVELPEYREKMGKPKSGTVKLSAYHSAGNVVVEITDDGKGLDRDAIIAKARDRGLLNEGATLSDREVFNLVFEPGFSTAAAVTEISGRGVGMDVVKRNIETLRGQVEISSEPGKGSVFKMRLPLTLAIIDGMVIRVGKERYVIPTVSITRSIKPDIKDFSTVLNRGEILSIKGKLIPLFRLAKIFDIKDFEQDPNKMLVVVIEENGRQAGMVIDELIGRQQVVIKTLGETMQNILGISGGAVMPNGQVGLILDVGGLVKLANGEGNEGLREEV